MISCAASKCEAFGPFDRVDLAAVDAIDQQDQPIQPDHAALHREEVMALSAARGEHHTAVPALDRLGDNGLVSA